MAFTQVALTGVAELSPGTPAAGAVITATLTAAISDGVTSIVPAPITARCASDGSFSLTVPANDDLTTQPQGTAYKVQIVYGTQLLETLTVTVPHADAPSVALFSLVAPSGAPAQTSVAQLRAGAGIAVSPGAGTGIVEVSANIDATPTDIQMDGVQAAGSTGKLADAGHVHPSDTSRAPLASPALTGTPTAPTAPALTDSTQVATTAYADAAVTVEKSRAQTAEGLLAPLASPAFTGSPTAPTQTAGDNSAKLATTAFVTAAAGVSLTSPNGSITVGGTPAAPTVAAGPQVTVDIAQGIYATMLDAANAAVAAVPASTPAEIRLPAGTVSLDKTGNGGTGILLPLNRTATLSIRGHHKGTILVLSANTKWAFGQTANSAGDTLANIAIGGIVVNANNITGGNGGVALNVGLSNANVSNLTIEDFEVINAGGLSAGLRCVSVNITTTAQWGATQYSVSDVTVRRFKLGLIGGGANTGIYIGAYAGAASPNNSYYGAVPGAAATVTRANVVFDRIVVEDGTWTSGQIPTATTTSAGVQIGGDGLGLTVHVRRVTCIGAGDVNYEFDSILDLHCEDCVGQDAQNEDFFLANNHGGLPAALMCRQVARYVRCLARRTVSISVEAGFMFQALHGSQFGHVIYEDCAFEHLGADFRTGASFLNPNPALYAMGAFRQLTVRNFRMTFPTLGIQLTASNQTANNIGIVVSQSGDTGVLEIHGAHMELDGTCDNTTFTGGALQPSVVRVDVASRLVPDIDGVSIRSNITALNGYSIRLREVEWAAATQNLQDKWNTSGTLAGDYICDLGTVTNLSQGAGVVTSAANPTTRNLFRAPMVSATGATKNQIGKVSDGTAFVQGVISPTGGSAGMELIGRLKVSDAGTSELRAVYDGTNHAIRIEKVASGTVTVLVANTAVTGDTAGTTVGIRLKQSGNVLTADFYTGAAIPAVGTAGATTISYTLAGVDVAAFGATGPLNMVGWGWTPGSADATLTAFRHDQMAVIAGGRIANLRPLGNLVTPSNHYGFYVSAASGQLRIDGMTRVTFVRSAVIRDGSAQQDINLNADPNVLGHVTVEPGSVWAQPPGGAAITVGASPFAWTNTNPWPVRVGTYGGTVSSVAITDAVGTARQLAAATGAIVRVSAGETLTTIYTAAPTQSYVPEL